MCLTDKKLTTHHLPVRDISTTLDEMNAAISEGGQYSLWVWGPTAIAGLFILRWLTKPEPYKGVPEPVCALHDI